MHSVAIQAAARLQYMHEPSWTLVRHCALLQQANMRWELPQDRQFPAFPGLICRTCIVRDYGHLSSRQMSENLALGAGNIPRALTMYQQLYQGDPDNTAYGKTLKRLRALVNGREAGNTAFKESRYQQAYDECDSAKRFCHLVQCTVRVSSINIVVSTTLCLESNRP
jgi:hypothetical protein